MLPEENDQPIKKKRNPVVKILINRVVLKQLIKSKKKRLGKDYVAYLNRKVEGIVLAHIHMLGSRGTLNAKDFIFLDAVNKGR